MSAPLPFVAVESPMPTLEEMARLLFSRPDGEAGHAKRRVLVHYATVWAQFEGVAPWRAQQMAEALADDAQLTRDEREANE